MTTDKPIPGISDVNWVFGYGSLMWRPGFPFLEQRRALLRDFHRAPCVYSHYHRGTAAVPGLVLGLDQGGECDGIAFRFADHERTQIIAYLNERELIGYAYKPVILPIEVAGDVLHAYTFIAAPEHPNYAGSVEIEVAAQLIMRAQGVSGLNRDYLINTVEKLEQEGFADAHLRDLLRHVRRSTGELDQGGGI